MEAKRSALLLLCSISALLLATNGAPVAVVDDEVLARLNSDLDALLETGEADSPVAEMERQADSPVAEMEREQERDQKSKDPLKQRGTYTKEMKKYEKERKWHKEHPKRVAGVKKKYDALNDFKNPEDEKKRAQKIARDIYKIIHKPVAKKAEETEEQRRIRLIKEKGKKDAKFLHRIYEASKKRDRREEKRTAKDDARMAKEKRKPKLAIKHRILSSMAKEDKKLEKDPPLAAADAVHKVEVDGQPKRKKLAGMLHDNRHHSSAMLDDSMVL